MTKSQTLIKGRNGSPRFACNLWLPTAARLAVLAIRQDQAAVY